MLNKKFGTSAFLCLFLFAVAGHSYGQSDNKKSEPVARLFASYTPEKSTTIAANSSSSSSSASVATTNTSISVTAIVMEYERKAFDLINEERKTKGIEPLKWDPDLLRMARLHSQNMSVNNFFAHTGPDGVDVKERAKVCGVVGWKALGENIAYNLGYSDPASSAVVGWKESPKHYTNLLRTVYTHSAIGVSVTEDGHIYFTQVFAAR
jgi:uncharacterized protein YkwD